MKRTLLLVGVAIALIAADDKKTDAKGDKAKLEGAWTLVSGEAGGGPLPDQLSQGFKLTFKGDRYTVAFGGNEMEGELKVDDTKKPKEVDFKADDGTRLGIYEVDGDKMKLCVSHPGMDRPTELKSKEGSQTLYFVLKKEKAK